MEIRELYFAVFGPFVLRFHLWIYQIGLRLKN